jgi:hypothetical protein
VLPVIRAGSVATTSIPKINPDVSSQLGWDKLVAQVSAVADSLTPAEKVQSAILTANYGEAGALELYGGPNLPPVYSGENSYAYWGPPAESRTITILVMNWDGAGQYWGAYLGPCELATTLDVGLPKGVGEEQGAGVWLCRGRVQPWSDIWPVVTTSAEDGRTRCGAVRRGAARPARRPSPERNVNPPKTPDLTAWLNIES